MKKQLLIILLTILGSAAFAQQKEYYDAIIYDDKDSIIKYGEQLLKSDGTNTDLYKRLAIVYKEKGLLKKSLDYLNSSYRIDSSDIKTVELLGDVYYDLGNEDSALKMYLKCLELDSLNTKSINMLIRLYQLNKDTESAIILARKLCEIDSTNASYFRNAGKLYENKREFKKASAMYLKAVRLDSTNIGNILLLSNMLIMNKQLDSAIAAAKLGLTKVENKKARVALLFQRNIANAFYNADELDSCLHYIHIGRNNGDTVECYSYKLGGYASFQKGFFLDASEDLKVVYDASPDLDSLNYNLTYILGRSYSEVGDLKNATRYLTKALENIQPNYKMLSATYTSIGVIKEKQKYFKEALAFYSKAKDLDPENFNAYHRSEMIYSVFFKDYQKGINELRSFTSYVDSKRGKGEKIGISLQNDYNLCLKMINDKKISFFFEKGADGKKRVVEERRNDNGEIIETNIYDANEYFKDKKK